MSRYLSAPEAQEFYDRFGSRQDAQAFYEDAALAALATHLNCTTAARVFELGCGTGRFAEMLLTGYLPEDARYEACDLSQTMVDLARARLRRFGDRVQVWKSGASAAFPGQPASYDLIVSTYVLDLLPPEEIMRLLAEAARTLRPGGQLGLISLTRGPGVFSGLASTIWGALAACRPGLVGGCRPVVLHRYLDPATWRITHDGTVTSWLIPSEVLVARRRDQKEDPHP